MIDRFLEELDRDEIPTPRTSDLKPARRKRIPKRLLLEDNDEIDFSETNHG